MNRHYRFRHTGGCCGVFLAKASSLPPEKEELAEPGGGARPGAQAVGVAAAAAVRGVGGRACRGN